MQNLTFDDYSLILDDLHTHRREPIAALPRGERALEELDALRARFRAGALPTQAKPLADVLGQADGTHDSTGLSVWWLTEAQLRNPTTSPELRDTLLAVRAVFMADPAETRATYVQQAANAKRRRAVLDDHAATLQAIPTPDGGSLLGWVTAYIEAGERIGALLEARSQANAVPQLERAALRRDAMAFLVRLRTLAAAAAAFDDAAEDTTQRLFGFVNDRIAARG